MLLAASLLTMVPVTDPGSAHHDQTMHDSDHYDGYDRFTGQGSWLLLFSGRDIKAFLCMEASWTTFLFLRTANTK